MMMVLRMMFSWLFVFLMMIVVMNRIDSSSGNDLGLMNVWWVVNSVFDRLLMNVPIVKVSSLNLNVGMFMSLVVFLFLCVVF